MFVIIIFFVSLQPEKISDNEQLHDKFQFYQL